MSRINTHQIMPYLVQHGISLSMITILEEQRINEEDLQTIDRNDIEHLFKNEYGFTFGDRKRFWSVIQKFQSMYKTNSVVYIEQQDETPNIYEIIDDESSDYQSTQCSNPLLSSKTFSSTTIYKRFDNHNEQTIFEESSSENNDDNQRIATTSFPPCDNRSKCHQSKISTAFKFRYPVDLPVFSSKVMKALETNSIESEWKTLMKELVPWILTKTLGLPTKSEYQAIGQTIFKLYPSIGRDGFRPWSHLCKSLTEALRKERYKRGLPRARQQTNRK